MTAAGGPAGLEMPDDANGQGSGGLLRPRGSGDRGPGARRAADPHAGSTGRGDCGVGESVAGSAPLRDQDCPMRVTHGLGEGDEPTGPQLSSSGIGMPAAEGLASRTRGTPQEANFDHSVTTSPAAFEGDAVAVCHTVAGVSGVYEPSRLAPARQEHRLRQACSMPAPQADDVGGKVCHLSRCEVGGRHVLVSMGVREKRLHGLKVRIRPVRHLEKAWRIAVKEGRILLMRDDDMTDIALGQRQTAAFAHRVSMSRLLHACGGDRAREHYQKGRP